MLSCDSELSTVWFSSYLHDRQQKVVSNDCSSAWLNIDRGLPQGSTLGPLLFSLYINDCPEAIKHCKHHLYADDLQIYLDSTVAGFSDCTKYVNHDLEQINKWSEDNILKINPLKSQAIVIGYPTLLRKITGDINAKLILDNTEIPICNSVNNLGLCINNNLTWLEHVVKICNKVYSSIHSLRCLGSFLTPSIKIQLVNSLIMPHFDYADIVYQDLSQDLASKLQRAQNASVRFMFNLRNYDHIFDAYNKISWIKLEPRRRLHVLTSAFNILRTQTPEYLFSEFVSLESIHNCNTRGKNNLLIPNHRTEMFHKSFIVTAIKFWNAIPPHIKSSSSTYSFKKKCISHLLVNQSLNLYFSFNPKL